MTRPAFPVRILHFFDSCLNNFKNWFHIHFKPKATSLSSQHQAALLYGQGRTYTGRLLKNTEISFKRFTFSARLFAWIFVVMGADNPRSLARQQANCEWSVCKTTKKLYSHYRGVQQLSTRWYWNNDILWLSGRRKQFFCPFVQFDKPQTHNWFCRSHYKKCGKNFTRNFLSRLECMLNFICVVQLPSYSRIFKAW